MIDWRSNAGYLGVADGRRTCCPSEGAAVGWLESDAE
jgi:hypothetical protein